MKMRNSYRIVADRYAGFEAQFKPWWFPVFWLQCYCTNTQSTLEAAEKVALRHAGSQTRYLGKLPHSTPPVPPR